MEQLFLIAHVAGRAVAIAAEQVESVVDVGVIVAVPRAGGHVRGLTALRSRVVTVIDTIAALGMAAPEREPGRAVITRVDGHHYALLVDSLDDVAPFELQPIAQGVALSGAWAAAARGLIQRDGEPILAIDLIALVPGQPAQSQQAA
ncbi:chemotaxis protein CheW [Sphingomonas turrisvirgatae]|uniref:Chemotaxis protein CheW n=1 Tax=Sphingomonas turrisvirgatae TaxID=1888892 RepID=A0A1E3LT21_9SPHN|nr:chemotaxis protein CheW [Sphingomonas turrisvirgatae]ODP36854.1 chemotaxis protein CheW [Sphingomonas turrisvirgatae]